VTFDAIDASAIASGLRSALASRKQWREWSRNGLRGVRAFYSWDAHVEKYLRAARRILRQGRKRRRKEMAAIQPGEASPFLRAEWVLICDLESTLLGDPESLARLQEWIRSHRGRVAFGVATGRILSSALWRLRGAGVDPPDLLITGVGSEIHYGPDWRADVGWENHISKNWRREELARALQDLPGLRLQAQRVQGRYKLSYYATPSRLPPLSDIYARLNRQGLRAKLIYSRSRLLDVLPHGASKGQAARYLAIKWGLPLDHFVVAGDSGNDYDLLTGGTLGIVVANHSPELESLRGRERIHFASQPFAAGIQEGLEHYHL
jgi:sucrose-phosphate synthase